MTITVMTPHMHIGDLDGTSRNMEDRRWRAVVTIAVHEPVAEAKASGTWIRGDRRGRMKSRETNRLGKCRMSSGRLFRWSHPT